MHANKAFAFGYFAYIYVCLCVYDTMKRRRVREIRDDMTVRSNNGRSSHTIRAVQPIYKFIIKWSKETALKLRVKGAVYVCKIYALG